MKSNLTKEQVDQFLDIQNKLRDRLDKLVEVIGDIWPTFIPSSTWPDQIKITTDRDGRQWLDMYQKYDQVFGCKLPVELIWLTDEELIATAKLERQRVEEEEELDRKRRQESHEESERRTLAQLLAKYADYSK